MQQTVPFKRHMYLKHRVNVHNVHALCVIQPSEPLANHCLTRIRASAVRSVPADMEHLVLEHPEERKRNAKGKDRNRGRELVLHEHEHGQLVHERE